MSFFFKSEDSRRQDATARKTKQGKTRCPACDGTGTFGIGGRGRLYINFTLSSGQPHVRG